MKKQETLDKERVTKIVQAALKEDIGKGDITTFATIPKLASVNAGIIMRESGIICGLPIAEMMLNIMDSSIRVKPTVNEGDTVADEQEVMLIEGRGRPILMAERTILNFLGRLSGVATQTAAFVEKIGKLNVKVMDTRKTTPLLRYLEKYAVRVGGGYNHRMGLWDQVLIKDNHIKVMRHLGDMALDKMPTFSDMIKKTLDKKQENVRVEVEVSNLKEYEQALQANPDIIMLDNMSVDDVKLAVEMRSERPKAKKPQLEASGGITLDNVAAYAATGVDRISLGALTNKAPSLDIALEIMG
jgi:nicotinate-nucleotide pyrophosphorylase (carboxylating)